MYVVLGGEGRKEGNIRGASELVKGKVEGEERLRREGQGKFGGGGMERIRRQQ